MNIIPIGDRTVPPHDAQYRYERVPRIEAVIPVEGARALGDNAEADSLDTRTRSQMQRPGFDELWQTADRQRPSRDLPPPPARALSGGRLAIAIVLLAALLLLFG